MSQSNKPIIWGLFAAGGTLLLGAAALSTLSLLLGETERP